jgi:hypothetical protein
MANRELMGALLEKINANQAEMKAMKEMMDTNQTKADINLKELKRDIKASQDKMDGR